MSVKFLLMKSTMIILFFRIHDQILFRKTGIEITPHNYYTNIKDGLISAYVVTEPNLPPETVRVYNKNEMGVFECEGCIERKRKHENSRETRRWPYTMKITQFFESDQTLFVSKSGHGVSTCPPYKVDLNGNPIKRVPRPPRKSKATKTRVKR